MRFSYQKVTIYRIRKPQVPDLNEELQWFASSLGLFNLRDKDNSQFRIFIELLKATKRGNALSSDELAHNLNLSRGTVMHHINKLMNSGIVISEGRKYLLRVDSLKDLVDEIEADLKRTCDDLKRIATSIDRHL